MHLSQPLFNLTQWKDKCTSYSFTSKKMTHSSCQVSLVVKYILNSLDSSVIKLVKPHEEIPTYVMFNINEVKLT